MTYQADVKQLVEQRRLLTGWLRVAMASDETVTYEEWLEAQK
jgi:hypothetical protein